jgi:integrase
MPSITSVEKGFRAQVYVKGVRDSATFRTKREAVAWSAARETELRNIEDIPIGSRHTLEQVMNKYAKEVSPTKGGERWERVRIALMLRSPDFPSGNVGEITPTDIGQWRDIRLGQVKPGSVIRELGLLSAIFEHARREWRYIKANPVADVRKPPEPKHREVLITRQQIYGMLKAMNYSPSKPIRTVAQAVAVCFLVALRTGMRAGELCALTWEDVFPDHCRVRGVEKGAKKTGMRNVPMTSKAIRLINKMRLYDPLLVFGLAAQSMDAMFRKYRGRAGLSGFTFHDSRHYAATHLAKKIHVLELCKVFGWSSTTRALTYFNPSMASLVERMK